MNKIIFILISFLMISTSVHSQEKQLIGRKKIKEQMQEKIRILKNGALLVRMHSKENSIQALTLAGNDNKAKQLEFSQNIKNLEIITAFRIKFMFCPVYFFSSKYSENVASGNMEGVVFYNDNFIQDSAIKFVHHDFLTAEFGFLEPDTASYYDDKNFDRSGKILTIRDDQYAGDNMGLVVLKIMDRQFIQLRDPFKYYVRTYERLPVRRRIHKTVARMNKKLWKYYDKNLGK